VKFVRMKDHLLDVTELVRAFTLLGRMKCASAPSDDGAAGVPVMLPLRDPGSAVTMVFGLTLILRVRSLLDAIELPCLEICGRAC
jgi:hypothetical protein